MVSKVRAIGLHQASNGGDVVFASRRLYHDVSHGFSLGGAEGAAEAGEGFDDLGGPLGEFVVAEGAVVGLEDGAEEEGVDAGVFLRVAPDFDGLEALELGDGEGVDGGGDGVPLDGVGQDEGEVALDGLEAGEVVGGDFLEGELVEFGEVELGEVDGLAEFAGFALGVG